MDGHRGDDFLNWEGTMIFVVQLLRGAARLDIASAELYQVSYLICWRRFSACVCVSLHSLLGFFQSLSGHIVHRVHPVGVCRTSGVERFCRCWVHGCGVEAIVSVEWRNTVTCVVELLYANSAIGSRCIQSSCSLPTNAQR